MAKSKILFNPQVTTQFKELIDGLDYEKFAEVAASNCDCHYVAGDVDCEIGEILGYMERGYLLEADSTMLMYELFTIEKASLQSAPTIQKKRFDTFLVKFKRWY